MFSHTFRHGSIEVEVGLVCAIYTTDCYYMVRRLNGQKSIPTIYCNNLADIDDGELSVDLNVFQVHLPAAVAEVEM